MADALGLSAVHVNRVLRGLREDGLVTFQHGQVEIHDLDALVQLADFDKTYLDHDGSLGSLACGGHAAVEALLHARP